MAFTKEELDELRPKYVNQVPVDAATSQPKPNTIPDRIPMGKTQIPDTKNRPTPEGVLAPNGSAVPEADASGTVVTPVQTQQETVAQAQNAPNAEAAAMDAVLQQFGVQLPEETVFPEVNKIL